VCLQVVHDVAGAIGAAYAKGVLHRDITPVVSAVELVTTCPPHSLRATAHCFWITQITTLCFSPQNFGHYGGRGYLFDFSAGMRTQVRLPSFSLQGCWGC
jgi:hypothetical protein